jgi:hypothetical protein
MDRKVLFDAMANILEFLRGVITEPEARGAFQADPDGYIEKAGFVDLTGEDVVEAVLVLRRSLPEDVAARLSAFEDDDGLPAVRPGPEETELDAAVRMLHFAIQAGGTATTAGPSGDQPIDVENELDTDLAPAAPAASTAGEVAASSAQTLQRFSDDVDTIVGDAAEALEKAAAAMRDAVAAAVGAADTHARQMRAEADVERESARVEAERIRTEADNELQRAREQAEESRRRAEELVASAQAESEATHAELAARRAELREVERQLKQRLHDIDSLFRAALGDEGDAPPA